MKMEQKFYDHLQNHFYSIEAQVITYRTIRQHGTKLELLLEELKTVYVTDKLTTPLPIVSGGIDRRCETYIQKAYIPSIAIMACIAPLLFQQSIQLISEVIYTNIRSNIEDWAVSRQSPDDMKLQVDQAANTILHQALLNYFGLIFSQGVEKRADAFEIVVDLIDQRVNPERCYRHSGSYLYNFESDAQSDSILKFSEDIEIRLTTHDDLARELYRSTLFENELPFRRFLPPRYFVSVRDTVSFTARSYFYKVIDIPNGVIPNEIDDVITALRLHQAGYVGRDRVHSWTTGVLPTSLSAGGIVDAKAKHLAKWYPGEPLVPYKLHEDDFEIVKSIFEALRASNSRSKLSTAVSRFNTSYGSISSKERVVDLVIALESLFGEETVGQTTEVGYRLRMRAARYLGKTSQERKDIAKFISDLYTRRSDIVHGSSDKVPKMVDKQMRKSIETVVAEAEEYVRIAIRQMLLNPSQVGSEYQNNLLLGIVDEEG